MAFEEFIFIRKFLILINHSPANLGQFSLGIHKYKSDSEVASPLHNKTAGSSPLGIFLASACTRATFVDAVTRNEAIYVHTSIEKEAIIQKHWVIEMVELLQYKKFAPQGFKLD